MRVLMVAADPMEFAAFRSAESVPSGADWCRRTSIGSNQMILVTNGAGKKRAAAAVDAAMSGFSPDVIVSTGFCGALSPELEVADVVAADCVLDGGRTFKVVNPNSACMHHTGTVVTIDHVAGTAAEKSALRARGGMAVEMEAAGVAERAEALGLPFSCVRVVTDLAHEDMQNDFNRALREDGHFATMIILKGTLRNPLVRLPELVRLRSRCARAARVLGEFIADCRF